MLPARFARLEFDARRTAREINDRRELLDWFLNAQKEVTAQKAAFAAQKTADDAAAARGLTPEASPTAARGGLMRSASAGRLGAEVVGSSPSVSRGKMVGSASTPMKGRRSPLSMPANQVVTMHDRVNTAMAAAQRNASELGQRRETLDQFKDIKGMLQEAKMKKSGLNFSVTDPLPPSTYLHTCGKVERLSFNSRLGFATNYSLQPLDMAVKEVPPPHPVHPTSSMLNRLEACESRVLWNHQTMNHNQAFLDDYKRMAGRD